MSRILIVCPTITGRESDLERCKKSYIDSLDGHEVVFSIPVDQTSWGKGVNKGISDVEDNILSFDYIHLTADDLEAHDGWFDVAVETLENGLYPAPMLLNPDGSVAGFGHGDANMMDTSVDWKPTLTSVVPTMTPIMWMQMGPMIPIHYATDDYLSHRARQIGFNSVARKGYTFTHHHSEVLPEGAENKRVSRLHKDVSIYNQYLSSGKWPEGE